MKRTNVLNQLNRLTLDNCSASFPSLTFPTIFYIEDIYIECGPSPMLTCTAHGSTVHCPILGLVFTVEEFPFPLPPLSPTSFCSVTLQGFFSSTFLPLQVTVAGNQIALIFHFSSYLIFLNSPWPLDIEKKALIMFTLKKKINEGIYF